MQGFFQQDQWAAEEPLSVSFEVRNEELTFLGLRWEKGHVY